VLKGEWPRGVKKGELERVAKQKEMRMEDKAEK
jgi:hypothetical protein